MHSRRADPRGGARLDPILARARSRSGRGGGRRNHAPPALRPPLPERNATRRGASARAPALPRAGHRHLAANRRRASRSGVRRIGCRHGSSMATEAGGQLHEFRRSRLHAAVAAAVYLGLALVTVRAVLRAPATTLQFPLGFDTGMNEAFWVDKQFVLSRVVEVAHTLATRPWTIGDSGLCHPMPQAHTLGEPMFAEGLLAFAPHLLTRNPILTYNSVLVLSRWIAACAMYALV